MAETGATIVLATLGTAVLLLVLVDALRTTLSIAEWPGPLTRLLNRTVWHGFRAITSRTDSPLLRSAGALLSALLVVVWLVLLWLGWTLVYAAVPESVVNAETGEAASFLAKAHFAASTLATAGHGDFVPIVDGWRVLAGLTTISGIALITLLIAYLVPVTSAAVDRVHFAELLHSLGSTAEEIAVDHWDGEGFSPFHARTTILIDGITRLQAEHLAYPVLHAFHRSDPSRALAPRVAALDEALTLMAEGVAPPHRLPEREVEPVRNAIDRLLETVVTDLFARLRDEVPPSPELDGLRDAGIPTVDDDAFQRRVAALADRRRKLLSYVLDDRWAWDDVHGTRSR
jgi:hypothetical protein